MRKCKLSPAARKKWNRSINETLNKNEHVSTLKCPLCKESNLFNLDEGIKVNRKNCIKNCIVTKFLKASNFKFIAGYPCDDYFIQEYNETIGNIRIQIIKSYLRQIRSWLKK